MWFTIFARRYRCQGVLACQALRGEGACPRVSKVTHSERGDDVRDSVVEGGFAVEVRLPEAFEELQVLVPAALVEAFAESVRSVFTLSHTGVFRVDDGLDDFAGGIKGQRVPQIARDGFVTLAAFAIDGQLHRLGNSVGSFVE